MATSLERRKEIEAQQAALRAYYRRNDTPTPAQTSAEAARKAREAEIQRAAENVSDWKRMRSTADRVLFHKPTTGLLSTVEGGVDFAMGLVGGVGGLFSEEFRDGVQDAIAYNATEEWVGKHLDELTKYSYTKDGKAGEIVDNVAQGVGQILPAVIVTIATAGAGAPSLVGEIASLAGTAVNAAGGATQEAYNEGAGYYEGLAYGTASGALEAGLEKLSEGTLGKLKGVGKGILDNALKGVAKTGVKRLAAEAVGEGVEEMVTEAATPLLKTIYKGKDAVAEYTDPAFYGQIGEAGLVGSLTSVATAGTLGKAFNPNGNPDIEASLDAIRTLETDADQYHMRDKLTAERYSDMKKAAGENLRNVEKVLQKASPEKRMKLMERYGLTEAFDQNGSLRVDFLEQSGFSTEAGQTGAPVPNAAKTQFSEYQSPSLTVGREHVEQAMAQITAELRQRDADAQAVERFDGTLDEASRSAYTKFKRAFGKLNREAGGRLSYVLVKPHSTFDGVRVGNTVYISADTLSNGKWVKTLIHEVTHVAEGTEAYQKYMKLLGEDAALVASAVDTVVNQKDYGFSEELAQRVAETEALDNLLAVQYNKKNRLINKTFPPYNESSSEANTLAVRWAKRMDVLEGQQKIISYHNQWYIIEKISNTDQGYQIVGTVKKSEYERKVAELKSYEREYTYATSLDEGISNYEYGDGGQSSDFAHVTDGQSNYNVSPMAEGERTGGAGAVPSKRDYQESNGAWQDNVTKSVKSEQSKSERNASPTVQYNRKQRTFKEGDETYGAEKGKNPKILGGQGAIRRIDRGRDSQRKQGDDPEKIYPWLGNDTTDGRAREKNGSGSSGWYRERSGNQLSVLRSGTGIFRNLRGRRVKATDTVGRAVSEKLRKRFANTVCKSEDGALLSLYHWTDAEFTTFAKGDIGFHFGTVQAAQRRCHQKQKEKRSTNISIYKEVYLNLCNPAVIDMDVMSWYVFPVSYKLNQQGIISNAELKILEACEGYYHSQYDSPAAVELRRILKEKGYDGIIYSNFNEGDISAIVFDADQIVTVAENGVDLERNNPTEQYSRESVAYIEKGSTNQLLNMNEISFPQPTSETSFDSNATNDSIPDSEKKVKSSRENSLTDETGARKTKTVPVSRGQMEKAREVFQKRLEAWDRKTDGFAFVMGETPSYLSDLEVQGKKIGKKQVRIDATKIKKIMQDHPEMTIEVIKHLPDLLNDPILVLDSKTVSGRLVLLGEVYAKEKPVMMALEINPTTRSGASTYVDVIKIASAYTRNNTQNMINTSKIRYIAENKSRVNDWLKVNRLQLPLPNAQSNSATHSIPDSEKKVKSSRENSLTDEEKSFASEVGAHMSESLLSNDAAFIERLVRSDVTLAEKALNRITDLARTFASFKSPEARQEYKRLRQAERLYLNAVESAGMIYRGGKILLRDEEEEDNKIAFSRMNAKAFSENVREIAEMSDSEAKQNLEAANFISVMKHTPSVVLENVHDAGDLEVIIRFDALYLATRSAGIAQGHYHDLGAEIMTNLPRFIENPDAIIRLENGRINLLSRMSGNGGKQGIISIELNAVKDINSHNQKYNLVISAFQAKDNYIKNILKKAVRTEYQKEDLSQVNPQLYEWLATINEKSSIDRISQSDKNVNPKSQFSRKTVNELEIKRRQPARSATRETVPNASSKLPSGNSITNPGEKVNSKSQFSRKKISPSETSQAMKQISDEVRQNLAENYASKTTGQKAYAHANQNQGKVYTKQDAKEVIHTVLENQLDFGDFKGKIAANMSDDERYEVLKDKAIRLSATTDYKKLISVQNRLQISEKDMEFSKYGDRVRLFKKIGEEFSVYHQYTNHDVQLDFSFSKENMRESVSKQRQGYLRLAKMFTCLNEVIDNAIGIEIHNRNREGYKPDNSLENVYVLASAFVDGTDIVPVKLEVKEFSDRANTLHLAIALESMKKDGIVKKEVANAGVARFSPPSAISIAEYFEKINPIDENFYKYIPKRFIESKSVVQFSKKEKAESTENTSKRTNTVTVSRGQMEKARANVQGEKVFLKKNVAEAVRSMDILRQFGVRMAAEKIKPLQEQLAQTGNVQEQSMLRQRIRRAEQAAVSDLQNRWTNQLWEGFNRRRDVKKYEEYVEIMSQNLSAELQKTVGLTSDELAETEKQLDKALRQIVREGKPSARTKMMQETKADYWKQRYEQKTQEAAEKAKERVKTIRQERNEIKERGTIVGTLMYQAQKMKELKNGTFLKASTYRSDTLRSTVEQLARINWRGNLNVTGTRRLLRRLREWYSSENPMLGTGENRGDLFSHDVANSLDALCAEESKPLSNDELRLLSKTVFPHFLHVAETWNKVFVGGKWVEARELARRYAKIIKENRKLKTSVGTFFQRNAYYQSFGDPFSVAQAADNYDPEGFFTQMFLQMEQGEVEATVAAMEIREKREEFLREHKGYVKRLSSATVSYHGQEISLHSALYLYMLHKRLGAWNALVRGGVVLTNEKGDRTPLAGIDPSAPPSYGKELERLRGTVEKSADALWAQFSAEDRRMIGIAEEEMRLCSQIKKETDELQYGSSNVLEGYYIPMYTADTVTRVDIGYQAEVNSITNPGFNKNTRNSSARLLIKPLCEVLDQHVSGVCLYGRLSVPLQTFNRILNAELEEGSRDSVRSELSRLGYDRRVIEYFQKLTRDLEGRGKDGDRFFNEFIRRMRSGYAVFQLGINPKTVFTQTTSYIAAANRLELKSLLTGFAHGSREVDEFCPLAKLRHTDHTAVKAGSVSESLSKFGKVMTLGISVTDRLVVRRLYAACKTEAARRSGYPIGTRENNEAAGRLLTEILLRTQQNSLMTSRSAAMRSDQELLRSWTMFSADAMKLQGRVFDAMGRLAADRQRLKRSDLTEAEREALRSRIKRDRRQLARSSAVLFTNAAMSAAIALLFKWLYGRLKDEEPEEIALDAAADLFGNMIGGLPLLRDVYSLFAEGYELDNFAVSMLNDVLVASSDVAKLCSDLMNGKDVSRQEIFSKLRNLAYGLCQIFGIPLRNAYNLVRGVTGIASPTAGYRMDSLFYNQSYRADLKKAIANDDEKMIATIAGLITDERMGGESDAARAELRRLVAKGKTEALPRSLGDSVTYDGEEIELTAKQKKRFRAVYDIADESVSLLVTLNGYREADDEIKAKAIAFLYETYYYLALEELMGVENGKRTLFAEAIEIEKLALIVCTAKAITADKDAAGKVIQGSRKKKVIEYIESLRLSAAQKHMVLGYLGYSQTQGRDKVRSYINTLNLSQTEKSALLKYSGYAA